MLFWFGRLFRAIDRLHIVDEAIRRLVGALRTAGARIDLVIVLDNILGNRRQDIIGILETEDTPKGLVLTLQLDNLVVDLALPSPSPRLRLQKMFLGRMTKRGANGP